MQAIFHKHLVSLVLLLVITACRKERNTPPGTASLTVINAVTGADNLVVNFSDADTLPNYYLNAQKIQYATFLPAYQFSAYSGTQTLRLYNYPDTLPKNNPLVVVTLHLPVGSMNSLFVTGTLSQPDTLLSLDYLPYRAITDSTTGIRFVNLSPGSAPVSVNLQGQPAGSEVKLLPYKGITGFKSYSARSTDSVYTFEFHDAASGQLLCTFTATGINNSSSDPNNPANTWRFRNRTLALTGLPDNGSGNSPQNVLLINNY